MVPDCSLFIIEIFQKRFYGFKPYMPNIVSIKWLLFQGEIKKELLLELLIRSV